MPWKPGAKRNSPSSKPEYKRDYFLRRTYGISLADYYAMLEEQGYCCAICGATEPGRKTDIYFNVDHCHETGKVRGLLCYSCNTLLGHAKDDPIILEKSIDYIIKYS